MRITYKITLTLKKALFFIIVVALVYVKAAEKTLVYSWSCNVGELNPHLYSPNQMFAQAMVYEPLVLYEQDGGLRPWLAQKWEISTDGKRYLFYLRKDVAFSDGAPFDAYAVKKNFDTVLKNLARHTWLELLNQIESVEIIDSLTVSITLKNAYYPFLQELSLVRPVRFLSPNAFPDDGNTSKGIKKAVGTGPWILDDIKKGEYDVFVRNENYWGEMPYFEKIIIKVIPDPDMRTIAFETGAIDLIYGTGGHSGGQISLESYMQLQKSGRYVAAMQSLPITRMVAINTNRGVTRDLSVRRAILHAVNKDKLLKGIFLGLERRADFIFDPSLPYCNLKLEPYQYRLETAHELLESSGWKMVKNKKYREKNGEVLETDFCYIGKDAMEKAVAEFIQAELKKIGIKVNLLGEEDDSFYNRQKTGAFGMIFNDTWGAPYDPHSFVSSMRAPSHADYQAQRGLAMKDEIDRKITDVLLSTDEEERKKWYTFVLGTLHEQAVYMPISTTTKIAVHNSTLTGIEFRPVSYEIPFQLMTKK